MVWQVQYWDKGGKAGYAFRNSEEEAYRLWLSIYPEYRGSIHKSESDRYAKDAVWVLVCGPKGDKVVEM